jgi:hypothetical protein
VRVEFRSVTFLLDEALGIENHRIFVIVLIMRNVPAQMQSGINHGRSQAARLPYIGYDDGSLGDVVSHVSVILARVVWNSCDTINKKLIEQGTVRAGVLPTGPIDCQRNTSL